MKNTKLEQFGLQKVKIKGNGLMVSFNVEEVTEAEVYHDEKTVKSDKIPHMDLTNILDVFKDYMAQIFCFGTLNELRDSKVFHATKKQIDIINAKYKGLVKLIKITGVSISGKEDNKGIIITGTLKTETGQVVAINSQRIKYNGTKYGFEEKLEELIEGLEEEVFEYVINDKKAVLEFAFDDVDGKKAAANDNDEVDIDDVGKMEVAMEKVDD